MSTRSNNFDALRLAGALLVAVSHSFDVILGSDPLAEATSNQSLGGIGLNIFCVISGFLITNSRMKNESAAFFSARALRIFPALVVGIPLMILAPGLLVTTLKPADYFSAPATWHFLGTILVFPLNPSLPGVFNGAPLVAQLYSLTAELSFYIFVGLLGRWRHYRKLLTLLLAIVLSVFVHFDYTTLPFSSQLTVQDGKMVLFTFPFRLGLLCVFYLLAGSTIALLAPDRRLLTSVAPIFVGVWLIALFGHDRHVYDMAEMFLLPVAIVGIGLTQKVVVVVPKMLGDVSYGIYIYHFAVAELVHNWKLGTHHGGALIVLSVAITTCVAWVSYHAIEKRALALKRTNPIASEIVADGATRVAPDSGRKPV
jgi:peptidoglycan/LPS O-acetylase OafA/YrhL